MAIYQVPPRGCQKLGASPATWLPQRPPGGVSHRWPLLAAPERSGAPDQVLTADPSGGMTAGPLQGLRQPRRPPSSVVPDGRRDRPPGARTSSRNAPHSRYGGHRWRASVEARMMTASAGSRPEEINHGW
jgi:hypothetical protein